MRRQHRLRSAEDFRRVRRDGRSWAHPALTLWAAAGVAADGPSRIGVTASRKVGGAVTRNRLRRRVREQVRARYARLKPGWDLVLVVRPAAAEASSAELGAALDSLFARAGLLRAVVGEAPCAESPSVLSDSISRR
jgi:ribonuclease P protein component